MKAGIYGVLLIAFILFTTGCSFEYKLKFDARLPLSPAVKPTPLNVGVYYSQEFLEYTKRVEMIACGPSGRKDKTGIFFIFPVGTASREVFDQIIASMFATVTTASRPSQFSGDTSPIDYLLEPRIESFDWGTMCSNDYVSKWRSRAKVSYVINLYNTIDSRLVTSMHVEGQSILLKPKACFMLGGCNESLGVAQAIQDAMARFMIDFYEQPEVKQWILSHVSASGNSQ